MTSRRPRFEIAEFFSRRAAQVAARLILGGVFIYAAAGKIADPKAFARIVVNYQLLPEEPSIYLAYLLPWVELIAGAALVAGLFVRQAAGVLCLLLVVFIGAIGVKALNGTLENCGCFTMTAHAGGASALSLLARDLLLMIVGAYLIVVKRPARAGHRDTEPRGK